MRKAIAISLLFLLGACGDGGFLSGTQKKVTTVTNTQITYPSLPDIDKPLPPILKSVTFDYPRDITKPKQVKSTPECIQQPQIPDFQRLCMEYPLTTNSNLFIGLDQQSFKNYVSNQESVNGYNRILNTRIDEVNTERARWRDSNQQKDK
jgi:hypothetical protein